MVDSMLWRIKVSLQYTGWLQYAPVAVLSMLGFQLSRCSGACEHCSFLGGGYYLGWLFFSVLVFDVATVKFRLGRWFEALPKRPDESLDDFDLMLSRYSCRSFQARKLSSSDREELLEYSDSHSQGLTSKLIRNQGVRFEYVAAAITVWPVVGASEFLVAIAPREYNPLSIVDVGRRLQKIVLKATRMGLGTCWIGPGAKQESVIALLDGRFNQDEDHVICVCAIGYESRFWPLFLRAMYFITSKRRLPYSSLFFTDQHFKAPLDVSSHPYSRFRRCYDVCRWSPSSFNAQPTRLAAIVSGHRLVRFDFAASTASRYYAPVALGIWCANWEIGCEALGIPGHYEVLGLAERKCEYTSELPRYYVSWLLDNVKSE